MRLCRYRADMNTPEEPESAIADIAASIRQIRKQKGLTLKEVEKRSEGKWKAVVVGSYERRDRALSLNKAIGLAEFYQVPLEQLLGLANSHSANSTEDAPLVIDLRRALQRTPGDASERLLQKFLNALCSKRRDWNGEVLSLRTGDLGTLAIILDLGEGAVRAWLAEKSYLFMATAMN